MEINSPIGIITKVDAINQVLEAISSVGINSDEEIEWNIDAADADKLIDTMSQRIQTNQGKGWWFNREEFHKLTPDSVSGYVTVPNNTLACYIKRTSSGVLPVTLRGNILFDSKNLGYDMRELVGSDGNLPAVLVMNLPFEHLPSTVKHAITDAARYWTVNNKEGDQVKMAALKTSADASYTSVLAEDARQKRRNILNNPSSRYNITMAGGY